LPKAGGAMTGAITTNSTFDGRDVAADGVTADAALPKAGGTMTGVIAGFTSTGIDDNATSTAITIDASENVGIGTASPARALEVYSSQPAIKLNNGTNAFTIGTGAFVDGSNSLVIYDDGVGERMRIDSSGTVGIGTSSAGSWTKLEVAGTGGLQNGATQALHVSSPSATANEGVGIRLNAGSGSHEAVGVIGMVNNASGNYGSMTFHTYSGGSYITERMRIDSGGHAIISGGVTLGNGLTYAAANTLDDYEEGTFTPAWATTSGAQPTVGYSSRFGHYVKVGRLVTLRFEMYMNALTVNGATSSVLILNNLPFALANPAASVGSNTTAYFSWARARSELTGYGFNEIGFLGTVDRTGNAQAWNWETISALRSNSEFRATFQYETNS
jgi:hypothetical protein